MSQILFLNEFQTKLTICSMVILSITLPWEMWIEGPFPNNAFHTNLFLSSFEEISHHKQ